MDDEARQQKSHARSLSSHSYWQVNKHLARKIGVLEVLLLAEFLYREDQYLDHPNPDRMDRDRYFDFPQQKIAKYTSLSPKVQKRCCDTLKAVGILQTKQAGIPRKKWYRINHDAIDAILESGDNRAANKSRPKGYTDNDVQSQPIQSLPKGDASIAQREILASPKRRNSIKDNKNLTKNLTTTTVVDVVAPDLQNLCTFLGLTIAGLRKIATQHHVQDLAEFLLAVAYYRQFPETSQPLNILRLLRAGDCFEHGQSIYVSSTPKLPSTPAPPENVRGNAEERASPPNDDEGDAPDVALGAFDWTAIQQTFCAKLDPLVYRAIFSGVHAQMPTPGQVIVAVPSARIKHELCEKWQDALTWAILEQTGQKPTIIFEVRT
jgi:hypothetical protein